MESCSRLKLTCEDCGADIPAENINISRAVAKCAHCGAISGFADRVSNSRAAVERPQVALPPGIEVIDLGGELTLLRRWFSWKYAFLAVFCLFWNGFLVVWYTLALSAEETPVLMLVFPILHVAAGVGLSYHTPGRLPESDRVPRRARPLASAARALFIEQRIEATLGIKDVPVAGEVPR